MSLFTEAEITYLTTEHLLGRIATVGPDGMPHIAPVGWRLDEDGEVVEVGRHNLAATKKFKDVARTGRAAIVIDDVLQPWRPRGVEIRGALNYGRQTATVTLIAHAVFGALLGMLLTP